MLHARPDYNRIQDPAHLIPANEPVFLLRAQDRVAPAVLECWIELAEAAGASEDILHAARGHVTAMRQWQRIHVCKIPDMLPESAELS